MPDTIPHERLIAAAARLSSKQKTDEEWEVLDISMGNQPFHNNVHHFVLDVHGISCEQHDNKDLSDCKYLSSVSSTSTSGGVWLYRRCITNATSDRGGSYRGITKQHSTHQRLPNIPLWLTSNFLIGAGNQPDDLLIWRATFEHAYIRNVRI